MCGISGKLYFDRNRKIEDGLIHRMSSVLKHRGPDDGGIFEDYNFGFGMRRLSIIDVEGGASANF